MNDSSRDQRRAVLLATLGVALLIAEQVAARAVRDTLFLSAFGVKSLPLVMIGSALFAFAGAEVLAFTLARRSPARTLPAAALLSAAILLGLFLLAPAAPRLASALVYLHVAAFGGALVSGFWSMVNERFDPYSARRVMGRIGTGATAGGVAGGLGAWAASGLLPAGSLLLALAVLHAGAGLVLHACSRHRPRAPVPAAPVAARLAFPELSRSPYLRLLALLVFLGATGEALLDFLFKAQAARHFQSPDALLSVFALFHTAVSVGSLLLQSSTARPALERLGIARTVGLRPLLTALGSATGALLPGFGAALAARGAHETLTNSLFRSGYELLYTPLAEAEKRRLKAVIDVTVDKAGTLAGSALVMTVLALAPTGGDRTLFVLSGLVALAALTLGPRLHRGYVASLERSLTEGRVQLVDAEVIDAATRLTLAQSHLMQRERLLREIEAHRAGNSAALAQAVTREGPSPDPLLTAIADLRSKDPRALRRVLDAWPEPPAALVAALVPLLASSDSPLVIQALRRAVPRAVGQLVDALLDPTLDPVVRRRVPRVLKACPHPRCVEGLLTALDDPSFEVRASSGAALAVLHEQGAVRVPRDRVLERVRRELDAGTPVDHQIPQLYALLSLALEPRVLRIAWTALRGGSHAPGSRALRGTALEYLSSVLPEDVFRRIVSVLGASAFEPTRPSRPAEQVADELRASAVGLLIESGWDKAGVD